MSYVTEWTPVAGIGAVWGFVVLLFTPYLAPLVLGIALILAVIGLIRLAGAAVVAVVAALYRLARRGYRRLTAATSSGHSTSTSVDQERSTLSIDLPLASSSTSLSR